MERKHTKNPYAYSVAQNLKDAGCSADMVRQFLSLQERGDKEDQMAFLSCHREALLSQLHQAEKQIYCLDYLVYLLGKQKEGNQ